MRIDSGLCRWLTSADLAVVTVGFVKLNGLLMDAGGLISRDFVDGSTSAGQDYGGIDHGIGRRSIYRAADAG